MAKSADWLTPEALLKIKGWCRAGLTDKEICDGHHTKAKPDDEAVNFKHTLKPFKVGVIVYNQEPINNLMKSLFQKYAAHKEDKCIIKGRCRKIK